MLVGQEAPFHRARSGAVTVPPVKRHPYDQWSPDARALDVVGDKWTLLIVRDLLAGPRRFVGLQRVLPGISTEQLRSRLNRMVADGLLTRHRYREVPPRVDYELTERGLQLAPVLRALAHWGHDWAWGTPRPTETVDVTSIFRLGGAAQLPAGPDGQVEFVVDDEVHGASYRFDLVEARAEVREGGAEHPDAMVIGSLEAWVEALSPHLDISGLSISGEPKLALRLLEALQPPALAQALAPRLEDAPSVSSTSAAL